MVWSESGIWMSMELFSISRPVEGLQVRLKAPLPTVKIISPGMDEQDLVSFTFCEGMLNFVSPSIVPWSVHSTLPEAPSHLTVRSRGAIEWSLWHEMRAAEMARMANTFFMTFSFLLALRPLRGDFDIASFFLLGVSIVFFLLCRGSVSLFYFPEWGCRKGGMPIRRLWPLVVPRVDVIPADAGIFQ